jgi:hypothetical protein
MPAERLSMQKVREVLRLKYVRRAAVIGITWPILEELDDTALELKLLARAGYNPPRSKPLPECGHIHAELRRRGVTLALLWEESSRRLQLQPALRSLRRMAPPDHGDHAANPRSRRKAVRGPRRRYCASVRRAHRGGPCRSGDEATPVANFLDCCDLATLGRECRYVERPKPGAGRLGRGRPSVDPGRHCVPRMEDGQGK